MRQRQTLPLPWAGMRPHPCSINQCDFSLRSPLVQCVARSDFSEIFLTAFVNVVLCYFSIFSYDSFFLVFSLCVSCGYLIFLYLLQLLSYQNTASTTEESLKTPVKKNQKLRIKKWHIEPHFRWRVSPGPKARH